MYKEKNFGTPFKKKGCDPLSLKKFQLQVGTSIELRPQRGRRARHFVARHCATLTSRPEGARHYVTLTSLLLFIVRFHFHYKYHNLHNAHTLYLQVIE